MKFTERLKKSWRVLTRGRKAAAPRMVLWPSWRDGEVDWTLTNLDNYVHDGFEVNAIIYAAIMYKVRSASAAPLRAYVGSRDEREPAPPEHPLSRLLDRPNEYQSFLELDAELRVHFNLFGNAYVWFKRDGEGLPTSMIALRPDRVHHLYRGGDLIGFKYLPDGAVWEDGIPLLRQDTMHVRLPNPGDKYGGMGKGLSPIAPLGQSGDVDNAATTYLKKFFEMGAMPPGLLTFDVPMEDTDVAQARQRWMEIYGGSENWHDVAVMDQGGKYQRLGLSFAELDLGRLDGRTESRMAMCFGVPLTLIESRPEIVQSTYSNKEQDRAMFWEDTMVPELRLFEVEWSYFLHGEDGAFPAYNFNDVPALQPSRKARAERILQAAMAGLATRADYREAEGLPVNEQDRVYFVPLAVDREYIGVMPDTTPRESPPEPGSPADEEGRANAEEDEEQRNGGEKAFKAGLSAGKKKDFASS